MADSKSSAFHVIEHSSGLKLPAIGYGTWGGQTDSPAVIAAAVERAIRCGYRHIDMAEFYLNQKELGAAILKCIQEGVVKREELVLVSKVWNTNHHPDHVRASCLKTLRDLQVDYIDVLLVHWPLAWKYTGENFEHGGGIPTNNKGEVEFERVSLQDTWRAMEQLVRDGLVRHIGVSNYTVILLQDLLNYATIKPVCNQVEIHPYLPQRGLVDFCKAHDIIVVAYGTLGRKGQCDVPVDILADPTIVAVAKEQGADVTSAQVLLAWCVQQGISVLPKAASLPHMQSNLQANQLRLTDDQMRRLNGLDRQLRYSNPAMVGPYSFRSNVFVFYE